MSDRQARVAATLRAGRALRSGARQLSPEADRSDNTGPISTRSSQIGSSFVASLNSTTPTVMAPGNSSVDLTDDFMEGTTGQLISLPSIPTGLTPERPTAPVTQTTQVHKQCQLSVLHSPKATVVTHAKSLLPEINLFPTMSSDLDRELMYSPPGDRALQRESRKHTSKHQYQARSRSPLYRRHHHMKDYSPEPRRVSPRRSPVIRSRVHRVPITPKIFTGEMA